MACHHSTLPDGTGAIVCDRSKPKSCPCGRRATRLCDWKVSGKKSGTCDAPLCANCSTEPAPDKDLCPAHARDWKAWKAKRQAEGRAA